MKPAPPVTRMVLLGGTRELRDLPMEVICKLGGILVRVNFWVRRRRSEGRSEGVSPLIVE